MDPGLFEDIMEFEKVKKVFLLKDKSAKHMAASNSTISAITNKSKKDAEAHEDLLR